MEKQGQLNVDFAFGISILLIGTALVVLWALGEAFGNVQISTLGKWGLGLLPILIEIIQALIRSMK